MSVPEDISVMGFDGIALAEYYNPKIATIRQGYHENIPFELREGESVRKL